MSRPQLRTASPTDEHRTIINVSSKDVPVQCSGGLGAPLAGSPQIPKPHGLTRCQVVSSPQSILHIYQGSLRRFSQTANRQEKRLDMLSRNWLEISSDLTKGVFRWNGLSCIMVRRLFYYSEATGRMSNQLDLNKGLYTTILVRRLSPLGTIRLGNKLRLVKISRRYI